MLARYDTALVPPQDRIAYWHDVVCANYVQLECEIDDAREVRGAIEIKRLANLSVSEISGTGGRVRRRARDIRRATEEFFLLSLQLEQTTTISQRGAITTLRPGDMAAYSSTEPYELSMASGFRQIVLQIPKPSLLLRMPDAELALGRRIDGSTGAGHLIGQSILQFCKYTPESNEPLNDHVADILASLFSAALSSTSTTGASELSSSTQLLLLRAKSAIRHHFREAQFDRVALAHAVGVSVRRLNEIFATQETSASDVIRETRLQMAADELTDRRKAGLTVSDIALRNGFSSFSHFSTLFRKRFQTSPREWRQTKSQPHRGSAAGD
ncbi:helix-turn-helix domain-containing protein [Rhodopseudomonas palustris]|uniref:AraC-like ligand-binding domain-containing protein n=1 Tax=Rhodopseudomonas palustris TaxID=1076 RepID=UPI002ACD2F67|nr:helix-turn-helix domain-containing protein [Rhodopseudomonas palustris]WQH01461.1 helix-turn-helix domain-containing protein [Rhodopseudomonas palustris]